jgi:hypothetical protein
MLTLSSVQIKKNRPDEIKKNSIKKNLLYVLVLDFFVTLHYIPIHYYYIYTIGTLIPQLSLKMCMLNVNE